MSSGRGHLHVHAGQLSRHWPRKMNRLVKVAFKTGDTVTQDTAQSHKWIGDKHLWFQYSLLSIEMLDCGLYIQGITIRRGRGKTLLSIKASRPALGPTKPLLNEYQGLFSLGVKWLVGEAQHTPPSSVEVKNALSYTSTPHMPSWWSDQLSTQTTSLLLLIQ